MLLLSSQNADTLEIYSNNENEDRVKNNLLYMKFETKILEALLIYYTTERWLVFNISPVFFISESCIHPTHYIFYQVSSKKQYQKSNCTNTVNLTSKFKIILFVVSLCRFYV